MPCWRNPEFAGPLPIKTWENDAQMQGEALSRTPAPPWPPPPSYPPFSPLPGAFTITSVQSTVVAFQIDISGDASSFDEAARASLTSSLSTSMSCYEPDCYVVLKVTGGSIGLSIELVIPDSSGAARAATVAAASRLSSGSAMRPRRRRSTHIFHSRRSSSARCPTSCPTTRAFALPSRAPPCGRRAESRGETG